MKIIGWLPGLLLFEAVFAAFSSFGQTPPPNDNYSNSITLAGTDVTFSGTLAGATVEYEGPSSPNEVSAAIEAIPGMGIATQSVWWNWTAPVSTVVTFQVLSSSPAYPFFRDRAGDSSYDGIAVYTSANGSTTPAGLNHPAVGGHLLNMLLPPVTLSVPVTAGTNYQIQLIGGSSASYTIHMIATSAPVIATQPKSRAVYSNASCLFYVIAVGVTPTNFTYQWCFNGNPLTNQTAPMLALTNVDGTMAGEYSVVISNSAGFTVSQPATLTVSQSNVPISLSVLGMVSNNFLFSLVGENGRDYRIESSTDLVNWSPEVSFSLSPVQTNATSVIFNSNSPTMLTVPAGAGRKFFRANPYVVNDPVAEICINNLREIRVAEVLWAQYSNQTDTAKPWLSDLTVFFPNQTAPYCPLDTYENFFDSYSTDDLLQGPWCNIDGDYYVSNPGTHVLEDPQ